MISGTWLAAAALAAAVLSSPTAAREKPPRPQVWFDPNPFLGPQHATPNLFPLLTSPETSWPELASRTVGLKLFIDMFYTKGEPGLQPGQGTTDAQLSALIAMIKRRNLRVGLEFGGARWGSGHCTREQVLASAAGEQRVVRRWLKLGGQIDQATTDHANVWNVRGDSGAFHSPGVKVGRWRWFGRCAARAATS